MDYRDERDALRARVDSLEGELASARAESERMAATERALAAAQRENEKLRAEVRRQAPVAQPKQNGPPVAVIVGLAVGGALVAGVTGLLLMTKGAPAPPPPPLDGPGTREIAPQEQPVKTTVEGPTPKPPPEEEAKTPRGATVMWMGKVKKAEGVPFAAGVPCVIRATLATDGVKAQIPGLEVSCGGKTLHSSSDPLEGTSSRSYGLEEVPGPEEGSYAVALSYEDKGARSGARSQVSMSSPDRTLIAWNDSAPAFRVEVEIDELSSPWKGPALIAKDEGVKPALRKAVERGARVASATGSGLVKVGDRCSVDVRPAFGEGNNCRVRVQCGAATLYGERGGGFALCTTEGSSLLGAKDEKMSSEDRDPRLEIRAPERRVTIEDDGLTGWKVELALDAAGR